MDFLFSIIAFIVLVGVLVAIHEYGHFLAAKLCNVKVLRYSIGFGKVLVSRKTGHDQTEYCLSAIPLGGYVQLLDERSEDVAEEEKHRAFNRQSATKRIFILFAGPLANFLFSIVAYIFMFSSGIPGTVPLIGDVEPQSIAWQNNIRTGDQIVNVGGREVTTWQGTLISMIGEILDDEIIMLSVIDESSNKKDIVLDVTGRTKELTAPNAIFSGLGFQPFQPIINPVIASVTENSPAEKAGLKSGDTLLTIDGIEINGLEQFVELVFSRPGKRVDIEIQRNGEVYLTEVKLGVKEDDSSKGFIGLGTTIDKEQINQYLAIDKLVRQLSKTDYEVDEKDKNVLLTNQGIDNVEKIFSSAGILKNNNFYDPVNLGLVHHVNQALRANHLFYKGKDYIVKDGILKIIDELTGRILEGRRYGDGLHQALEAKEKIDVQLENQTLASTTYQNYFKLYKKISGCTGTAATESEEFFEIYNLTIISIPTNKKMIRKDWNDQIFRTEIEKNNAIVSKVYECHQKEQPILIFTSSINKSEQYSKLLKTKKIVHTVLNAKNHEKEAEIIANAGKVGSVIITTSISGRGVDIQLGGKKESIPSEELNKEKEKIKSLGGLFVIGTERMESRRVDNQARGRSGRQGDEGNSIFYVSLEDDLMRIFGSESMSNMLEKLGLKDGESIDHPWINKALERAQQKVEARNFDIRKTLLKFDNVLSDQRQVIFSERTNVMNNKEIFTYSDSFLNEIIENLTNNKKKYLTNPKSNEFNKKLISVFGKSFDDQEISKLIKLNDKDFAYKINNKFKEKRNERIKLLGENQAQEIEKRIFLQTIDLSWKSHIQYLEQLRQVIGLRSYGQRDPLIEYKKEAFNLFENLLEKLKTDLVTILINLSIVEKPIENSEPIQETKIPFTPGKKMKRNEPCFCGSGKKYKHCCGLL